MSVSPIVLVIQHERGAPPALVGQWLVEKGISLRIVHAYDGSPVPTSVPDGVDGVLVLGGGMGALDDEAAPWLPAVRSLLAACVDDDVPTFGLCLGGQLLAAATGGRITLGEHAELGICDVTVTPEGRDDPLARTVGAPGATAAVTQFHRDGIVSLPPGSVRLMTSSAYPNQAFRLGPCAWGVQFHPEVDAAVVALWLDDEPDIATSAGRDPDDVLREIGSGSTLLEATWRPFSHAFADVVIAAAERRRDAVVGSP